MSLLLEAGGGVLLEDGGGLVLEDGTGGGGTVPTRIGRPPLKSTVRDVVLIASTLESLECEVYCSADPTATPPAFAATDEGTVVDGTTIYSSGAWSTGYGTDGWSTARTPQFGTSGTFQTTSGTRLWLWIKTVAGNETAVWRVGTVIVL